MSELVDKQVNVQKESLKKLPGFTQNSRKPMKKCAMKMKETNKKITEVVSDVLRVTTTSGGSNYESYSSITEAGSRLIEHDRVPRELKDPQEMKKVVILASKEYF